MYILQEIQTTGNSTALVPAITYTDKNQGESAYYTALAAAAVSTVNVHTVMLYDEHGNIVRQGFYEHLPQET